MTGLTGRPRVLLMAVLLALGLIILWQQVLQPRNQAVSELRSRLAVLRGEAETARAAMRSKEALEARKKVAQRRIDEVDQSLKAAAGVAGDLINLEGLAEKHRLRISTVRILTEVKAGEFVRVPVEVSLSGPHQAVAKFLKDLEELPRAPLVDEVKTVPAAPGVSAKLVLGFYLADPAPTGPKPEVKR